MVTAWERGRSCEYLY